MRRTLIFAAFATLTAFAQAPRGFFQWWDRPFAKDLNLTNAQRRQIRTTIQDFRPRLIDARAAVEKAEVELQNAFEADSVDEHRANQAIDDLAKARDGLTRTVSQMALQLRMVLTPQQWHEVQTRRDQMMMRGRMRRQNAPDQ
jgi:Spy/CpxP family protein refolding chaperone